MNQQELNPTEQNNGYGPYANTQELEQPIVAESYQDPQAYAYGGYTYEQAPEQPVYQEYSYQQPVMPKAPKKRQKGNPVTMLIMSFITFVCMVMLPLISLGNNQLGFSSIYATDVFKLSSTNVATVTEEVLVEGTASLVDQGVAFLSQFTTDAESQQMLVELGSEINEVVRQGGAEAMSEATAKYQVIQTVLMIGIVIMAISWILILFAAAKGWKTLYNTFNIFLAFCFAAVVAICLFTIGLEFVGIGIWVTLAMLLASIAVCFLSKAKEPVVPVM